MQTFFTSLDLNKSAYSLWENGLWPGNRLFNQINEGLIVLRTLTGWYKLNGRKGWPHHACTRMWKGYEPFLAHYVNVHIATYQKLSGKNCQAKYDQVDEAIGLIDGEKYFDYLLADFEYPYWLTEKLCANHRSALLGKAKETVKQAAEKLNINWGKDEYCEVIQDKGYTKFKKAREVATWYLNLGWSEQPAQRVLIDGKMRWPYLWPKSERVCLPVVVHF